MIEWLLGKVLAGRRRRVSFSPSSLVAMEDDPANDRVNIRLLGSATTHPTLPAPGLVWTASGHTGTAGSGVLLTGIDNAGAAVERTQGDLDLSGASVVVTQARGLRETTGPTTLAMAGVSDGQHLVRSGATVAGSWRYGEVPVDLAEPPAVASLTWVNQSPVGANAASAAKIRGSLVLSSDYRTGNNLSMLVTTGTNLDAIFEFTLPNIGFCHVGLCWRESATGKIETVGVCARGSGLWHLYCSKWNSPTSWNSDRFASVATMNSGYSRVSLALVKSGTNLKVCLLGMDSSGAWTRPYLVAQWAQNNFFTTGPDQVGIFVDPYCSTVVGAAGYVSSIYVQHWVVT